MFPPLTSELNYNANYFQLPRELLRDVTRVIPWRGWWDITCVWLELGLLWLLALWLIPADWIAFAYLPLVFLIAGRQGAFLQLVHEASHGILMPSKKANHAAAKWFCA